MDIAGGDDRFAEFLADFDNASDSHLPTDVRCRTKPFVHEMHVHADRLHFQHIVEFR